MRRFSIFNLLGVGFLIAALYLGHGAVTEYMADVESQDWTETVAIVTDIDSREKRISRGRRADRYTTVYDISYVYQVDGSEYEGLISGASHLRVHGEEVRIKYDPDAPQDSTATLSPILSNLIVPLVAAVVFGIIGFFTSGLWALLRRNREPEEPEPAEAYMEVPEVRPDPVPRDGPGKIRYFLKNTVILVVFIALLVGFVVFMVSLGEKKEPVTMDAVYAVLEEQGYTPVDVTEHYSESWQLPLVDAASVQAEDMLFLFIEMDSDASARDLVDRLYSYSLNNISREPEVEYKYTGNNFVVHTMEAGGIYAMHIRVGHTVAYAQCDQSRAAEIVGILDSVDYFN